MPSREKLLRERLERDYEAELQSVEEAFDTPPPAGLPASYKPILAMLPRANASLTRSGAKHWSMASRVRLLLTAALSHYAATLPAGDFVETGVARGGSSILMMHVLDELQSKARHFACDSFQGLPAGDDAKDIKSCDRVKRGKEGRHSCGAMRGKHQDAAYYEGMFSYDQRKFMAHVRESGVARARLTAVPGWFNTSLPPTGVQQIAFMRLDGDLYVSTRDALRALYPLLAPGGAVYIDDYGSFAGCHEAVDEYRREHGVREPMVRVGERYPIRKDRFGSSNDYKGTGYEAVWWIKSRGGDVTWPSGVGPLI